MSRSKKVALPRPELNLTAMMDLVLNLITFFVLVANFAAASLPALAPPHPDKSLAKAETIPDRLTVSVMADEKLKGFAGKMKVGITEVGKGDIGGMIHVLEKEVKISAAVAVCVRADKSIRYSDLEPIMSAVAGTGVQTIHLVAIADEKK